jgi:phospholipase C
VIDALTADPKVWARTVLLVMFDENDGFFDHVPPPAPPSQGAAGQALGRLDGRHGRRISSWCAIPPSEARARRT